MQKETQVSPNIRQRSKQEPSCAYNCKTNSVNCIAVSLNKGSLRYSNLPHDRPKWMVMGSGRLHLRAALSNFASIRLTTLIFVLLACFVFSCAARRTSTTCQVDDCTQNYKRAQRRLEAAKERTSEVNLKRSCRVLKRLHRCLKRMQKPCRGNLLFHSLKHIKDQRLENSNCSERRKSSPRKMPLPPPVQPDPKTPVENFTTSTTTAFPGEITEGHECSYNGEPNYKHCGMFGDPHLRTFSDAFYTCKVEKTWSLINNDYMVVMVTNVPVKKNSSATVTTKITVLIKGAGKCTGQRHYVATSNQLPGAFTDGSSISGSVYVIEKEPGRHIEIRARFIATTVIIRRVGRYLTFAIRMPEEFVSGLSSKQQLCVHGCTPSERITPREQSKQSHKVDREVPSDSPREAMIAHDNLSSPNEISNPAKTSSARRFYFTEEEARIKCKQIILAEPGPEIQKKNKTKEETEIKANQNEKSKNVSPSLSSHAFSSLVPSPRQNSKKGSGRRRKNRMASAFRPEADISHSSFHQLQGEEETDAMLPSVPLPRRRRGKSKSKRSKRQAPPKGEIMPTRKDDVKSFGCNDRRNEIKKVMFNFYFDSCVFDLMTTGDVDFTLAAKVAIEDVRRTHVLNDAAPGTSLEVVRLWEPVENGAPPCDSLDSSDARDRNKGKNGASPKSPFTLITLLCVAASVAYLNSLLYCFSSCNTVDVMKLRRLITNSNYPCLPRRTVALRAVCS